MQNLAAQRCFNHARREAVARCPECGRFFCRECITEHNDRVVCAACLKQLVRVPLTKRRGFVGAVRLIQCAFGLLIVWFFFFMIGSSLERLPSAFHAETLWHAGGSNEP